MTQPRTSTADSLLEAMDAAAIRLLKRIESKDTDSPEGEGRAATISESVKVFEAIAQFAQWRTKPAETKPDAPAGSKFKSMKARFNGDAAPEGGGRRADA